MNAQPVGVLRTDGGSSGSTASATAQPLEPILGRPGADAVHRRGQVEHDPLETVG
jgi:hypothetical protein